MSEVPPQVTNWLYNVIQPAYVYKKLVYTQTYQFLEVHLNRIPKFKIRTSIYTSSITGKSSLLINLPGNVISRNGNVPTQIWIPFKYPYGDDNSEDDEGGVPLVFVTPSSSNGLIIKPGNHVDSQGRFYHPYLVDWKTNCTLSNNDAPLKYNILNLITVLSDAFSMEYPLAKIQLNDKVNSKSEENPPKPAKIPIQSLGRTKVDIGEEKDVSIEQIVTDNAIPLKYQKPLPLPDSSNISNIKSNFNHGNNSPKPSIIPNSSINNSRGGLIEHKIIGGSNSFNYVDLLDRGIKSGGEMKDEWHNDGRHEDILIQLTNKVNEYLLRSEENGTKMLKKNERILRFYDLLSHHYRQAVANQDHLDQHIDYVAQRAIDMSKLNEELLSLDVMNSKEDHKIWMSPERSVGIDDLIVPDSVLVNQLYDITSEIKAFKDLLGLMSGKFSSELEVMSDHKMDVCMKNVRAMARDVFWLELKRKEIASALNLSN